MKHASILRRFGAMVLDGLIIVIPAWFGAHAIPIVGGVVVVFLYYPIFESSRVQATIGKHLFGIRVTGLAEQRITFRQGCLRLLLKILSATCLFIGHSFAIFTEKHQAFHDIIAETVVLDGRNDVALADAWVEQLRAICGAGKSTVE